MPDLQNHWPKRFAVRYTDYGFTNDNFERGFQGKKQGVGELTGEKAGQNVRSEATFIFLTYHFTTFLCELSQNHSDDVK